MTYPCKRRFDIRSMGQWLYKNRGRPDKSDSRQWRETSNFVLNVVAKVVPCEGYATENGWLIDILGASGEYQADRSYRAIFGIPPPSQNAIRCSPERTRVIFEHDRIYHGGGIQPWWHRDVKRRPSAPVRVL